MIFVMVWIMYRCIFTNRFRRPDQPQTYDEETHGQELDTKGPQMYSGIDSIHSDNPQNTIETIDDPNSWEI